MRQHPQNTRQYPNVLYLSQWAAYRPGSLQQILRPGPTFGTIIVLSNIDLLRRIQTIITASIATTYTKQR